MNANIFHSRKFELIRGCPVWLRAIRAARPEGPLSGRLSPPLSGLVRIARLCRKLRTVLRMFITAQKRLGKIVLFAVLSCGCSSAIAQTHGPEGARAGGLGEAYAAISDDGDGIYYIPSGLIYSPQRLLFSFGVQNLFSSGLPLQNSLNNENAILTSYVSVVYNRLVRPNRTLPVLVLASAPPLGPPPAGGDLAPTSNIFSVGMTANFLRTGLLDQ